MSQLSFPRTIDELTDAFTRASSEAIGGCGASDVLYTERYSDAVDTIIEQLPPEHRATALAIAKQCGDYATEDERDATYEAIAKAGGCLLTGIDPDCCPCGRHP